jgi:hypothetical protein
LRQPSPAAGKPAALHRRLEAHPASAIGKRDLLDHVVVSGLDHLRGRFGQRAARHGDVLVGRRCCDDVTNLRLALMAILPNIAGLVLAFGSALRRSCTLVDASARATPRPSRGDLDRRGLAELQPRTAQKPYEQA